MLFCLRVIGQALVAFFSVSFLPPMEEWFSGFLPYPELLLCQILIILLYGKICVDFARGRGYFFRPNARLGRSLLWFGSLYLGVMIIRYIIRMGLYPTERWAGGSIPIFFHWVLAAFVLVLGIYHWSKTSRTRKAIPVEQVSVSRRFVRWAAIITVFVGILLWTCWQLLPSIVAHQLGLRGPQYAVRLQKHEPMTTADGITLVADVFHPQHAGRTPTILVRIPFSQSIKNSFYEELMGRIWAERGYTVVIQGTRGRYESAGSFYPLRGERRDGIETLGWISKQDWFNGQIATWGGSAFGHTQLAISDQADPGPSVLDVYEASTDFHRMFYPGGAFSLDSALAWAINSHGKADLPEWPSNDDIARGANGFPLIDADKRAVGKEITFFRDWVRHNEPDSYWRDIDGVSRCKQIKAPVLLMAGWYDPFLPGQLQDFSQIRQSTLKSVAEESRLIIGPWKHAGEVTFPNGVESEQFRPKSFAVSLPWFDEILHLTEKQRAESAPVQIFVMGRNEWRSEQEWPLSRTRYTAFYLRSSHKANGASGDGELSYAIPQSDDPDDTYVYDPRNPVPTSGGAMIGRAAGISRQNDIEARSDVLNYTSSVLKDDIEVTGPVSAVLFVTTSAISTDFTAKLVDVYPNGNACNVCDGILRRAYDTAKGPFQTNRPQEIEIQLWPTSIVFPKGHRIRLEISSSNFPRFDRNPNTGNPTATDISPVNAYQTVRHGRGYPSRLILPIIPERS